MASGTAHAQQWKERAARQQQGMGHRGGQLLVWHKQGTIGRLCYIWITRQVMDNTLLNNALCLRHT